MAGQLRVDELVDSAGTGSPSFPNGLASLQVNQVTNAAGTGPVVLPQGYIEPSTYQSISTNLTLTATSPRILYAKFTQPNLVVQLPDTSAVPVGTTFTIQVPPVETNSYSVSTHTGVRLANATTNNQGFQLYEIAGTRFWNGVPDTTRYHLLNVDLENGVSYFNLGTEAYYARVNTKISVRKIDSTRILFCSERTDNTIYAQIVSVNAGVVTEGTAVLLATATNVRVEDFCVLSSTAGLVLYRSGATITCAPLVFSDTTITVGTAASLATTGDTAPLDLQNSGIVNANSTQAVACYRTGTGSMSIRSVTHNGTSAPTFGTAVSYISSIANPGLCGGVQLAENKVLISAGSFQSSGTATHISVVTLSGTTVAKLAGFIAGNTLEIPTRFVDFRDAVAIGNRYGYHAIGYFTNTTYAVTWNSSTDALAQITTSVDTTSTPDANIKYSPVYMGKPTGATYYIDLRDGGLRSTSILLNKAQATIRGVPQSGIASLSTYLGSENLDMGNNVYLQVLKSGTQFILRETIVNESVL
jgi:hypothetical protein